MRSEIDNQKSRVDRYGSRVVRLGDFTEAQASVLTYKTKELLALRPELKEIVQTRIKQLVTHIFSLNEVQPTILLQLVKLYLTIKWAD